MSIKDLNLSLYKPDIFSNDKNTSKFSISFSQSNSKVKSRVYTSFGYQMLADKRISTDWRLKFCNSVVNTEYWIMCAKEGEIMYKKHWRYSRIFTSFRFMWKLDLFPLSTLSDDVVRCLRTPITTSKNGCSMLSFNFFFFINYLQISSTKLEVRR